MAALTVHIRPLAPGAYEVSWTGPTGPGDLLLVDAHASPNWRAVADLHLPPHADRRAAVAQAVLSFVGHSAPRSVDRAGG